MASEDKCPLKPVRTGKYSLKWTPNLESLRRALRWLFNKSWTERTPQRWELYRQAQQRYSKEVMKASKEPCRTFCSTVNDVLMSARLHRALSRDPKIKVGSLVAPSGKHMHSKGNTLELLLGTHFPDSVVTEDMAAPAAAHCTKQCERWVTLEAVIYGRVE